LLSRAAFSIQRWICVNSEAVNDRWLPWSRTEAASKEEGAAVCTSTIERARSEAVAKREAGFSTSSALHHSVSGLGIPGSV